MQVIASAEGWHWWFVPFWLILWIGVVFAIRSFWWRGGRCGRSDARALLSERFVRGEIDADEYRAKLDVLRQ